MFTSQQLRQKYLDFFKSKGHAIIPSASLIPENDPTVLFTTAGMHPLVPYLMGEQHPEGKRLADVQKCLRTVDIEEVGDDTHMTFMEMLGNWSLGDYFKKEAIAWSWEFLTSPDWLNLNKDRLAVTVFGGDTDFPNLKEPDTESANIWRSLGVPEERIAYMPGGVEQQKDNWWGPAGQTGPCGPSTEMFYWSDSTQPPPKKFDPSDQRWTEIWNDVLMYYNRRPDRSFIPLDQKNVDTGMGLERTLAVLNQVTSPYETELFVPYIKKLEELSGRKYDSSEEVKRSMRIIADHLRAATMIMSDDRGVAPSNVDQGYVVRKIIRRAIRHARLLGIKDNFTFQIAELVIKLFKDVYPEVERNKSFVLKQLAAEEEQFVKNLPKGLKETYNIQGHEKLKKEIAIKELNKLPRVAEAGRVGPDGILPVFNKADAKDAFYIYQTYGFPFEMMQEELAKRALLIVEEEFNEELKKHQALSRTGAEQKFKGGLADHSEESKKLHTATHLLHAALRKVLGDLVAQKGSNITKERLRFDFSHPDKMTPEQIKLTEDLVNQAIVKDYPVTWQELTVEEAKTKGAIGLFEEKYGAKVKVYSIGDPDAQPEAALSSLTFSKEICGGPHVSHTQELGKFKITKEQAVSAGIRRIKAILE